MPLDTISGRGCETMPLYRILSIDAGGTKGLFAIRLLRHLQKEYPEFLKNIDLFAGSSAGGLVCLCLTAEGSIKAVEDTFLTHADKLFPQTWRTMVDNALMRLPVAVYPSETRKRVFAEVMDTWMDPETNKSYKLIGDLHRKVCITTTRVKPDLTLGEDGKQMDLDIIHNIDSNPTDRVSILDAAMRTSAAPTYFPLWQGYTDGGVACPNPATLAVSLAVDKANVNLSDIRLISIGTGLGLPAIESANKPEVDWGVFGWLFRNELLINLLMYGNQSASHQMAQQLLGSEHYRRWNFILAHDANDVDDHSPELLSSLTDIADKTAQQFISNADPGRTGDWIRRNFVD